MEAPRWPRSEIPPPKEVGIDYVFSEVELDEILTFMQDSNTAPSLPAASMALQFLPSDGLGEPSYDDDLGLEGDAYQAPAHVQPFELGVPLDPELNPSSRQQGAEPSIKAEPQAASNHQGRHSLADMPGVPSGNQASAPGSSAGVTLARGTRSPGQAAHADTAPLSTAFAKLGAGGLSAPSPRPQQHSADPATAPATAHKRGESPVLIYRWAAANIRALQMSCGWRLVLWLISSSNPLCCLLRVQAAHKPQHRGEEPTGSYQFPH